VIFIFPSQILLLLSEETIRRSRFLPLAEGSRRAKEFQLGPKGFLGEGFTLRWRLSLRCTPDRKMCILCVPAGVHPRFCDGEEGRSSFSGDRLSATACSIPGSPLQFCLARCWLVSRRNLLRWHRPNFFFLVQWMRALLNLTVAVCCRVLGFIFAAVVPP